MAAPWLWPRAPGGERTRRDVRLRTLLAEAGAENLPPFAFLLLSLAAGIGAGAITWLLSRMPILGALALIAGLLAPLLALRARRARRMEARRAMWPDVCDLLVASVRSGMGLVEAVGSLAEAAPAPLRAAFAAFRSDVAASGHFDSSMLALKQRLADATADRIVETLRMTRQVGGTELPNVLRAMSATVRAEVAIRGEVAARQSWIRGAAVIGLLAPWVILAMLLARPEGAAAYGTATGVWLIVVAAVVSVVAFRAMVRIGRLPEPKRWFG